MANDKDRYWVGFDLGGTKMMATVFDSEFKKLASERKKTKGHNGMEAGLDRMVKTIQGALDRAGVKKGQVGGIGAGCPGPLDLDKGIILDTPNLGWKKVPIKEHLESVFGCPAVIGNDVDVGTYGEYRFGAARKARCVVGVFPGTGVGGACIYEGRILRGKKGSCMEIGHIEVERDGQVCGPGKYGSLESVASRLAISAQAAIAVYRGQAPVLQELAGTDIADIRSGILAEAIKRGDRVIEQIVRQSARKLGIAIAGVVNLLAPDVVVLGGGLVEAMPKLYLGEVEAAVKDHAMPNFTGALRIAAAQLGDDAGVMGAAALVEDECNQLMANK